MSLQAAADMGVFGPSTFRFLKGALGCFIKLLGHTHPEHPKDNHPEHQDATENVIACFCRQPLAWECSVPEPFTALP